MRYSRRHPAPFLDWAALVRRAQQWGITPYVYLPLQLARELVGATVPASVLTAMEPKGFEARLLGWARDEVLEDPGASPLFADLLQLWQGHGLKDRAAVVGKLWSPAALARTSGIPPTAGTRAGAYAVRFKDLVVRYGPVLWRLIRRDPMLIAQAERKTQLAAWLRPFHDMSAHDRAARC